MSDPLHLQSENPLEQIWIHLSQYESTTLARKLIAERARRNNRQLAPELLDEKATGLSYCLRNARDYLTTPPTEWTKRILVTYYGLLASIEAILISDPRTQHTLATIELATRSGHGIKNVATTTEVFPASEKVFLSSAGLFVTYLQSIGFDSTPFVLTGRQAEHPQTLDGAGLAKLVSLKDLLARVPEIAELYCEVVGEPPLNVGVFYATELNLNVQRRVGERQWLGLHSPVELTELHVRTVLAPPLEGLTLIADREAEKEHWFGTVAIRTGRFWFENLSVHRSAMCGASWVKPLFPGLDDALGVHCALLYALSILVRYRPSQWREVVEGKMDAHFALIRAYVTAAQRVLPEMILEKLIERPVTAALPGGFASMV